MTSEVETVILSDLHLADAEPIDEKRPYWKAYKQRRYFIDDDFAKLLAYTSAHAEGPLELILNGDTFDFDSIITIPEEPPSAVSWLSRFRGLPSEEWMSLYKMDRIVADHPEWFAAVRQFVLDGHRVVFVIGNHDVELHWPSVQERVLAALELQPDEVSRVRFATAFYISGEDTFVSHGHLFDPLCTEKNAIDPLILVHGRPRVRLPFGNMAMRYMLNGMGYFNPHASGNYIMTAKEYFVFFFRFMFRTQPFLLWTWFWSAFTTLFLSLRDFWRPEMRDPLMVDEKTHSIAERANTTPSVVRKVAALQVPSACTSPIEIARVLWLDRGAVFLATIFVAIQAMLAVNFIWPISPWWLFFFIALLFPGFLIYSFRFRPAQPESGLMTERRATLLAQITNVSQAVFGHTHVPLIETIGPIRYVNGGFWSPAFKEPTCENRIGTQTFVWIRPTTDEMSRRAALYEWPPGEDEPVAIVAP